MSGSVTAVASPCRQRARFRAVSAASRISPALNRNLVASSRKSTLCSACTEPLRAADQSSARRDASGFDICTRANEVFLKASRGSHAASPDKKTKRGCCSIARMNSSSNSRLLSVNN